MWVCSRLSITDASDLAQGPVCKSLPHLQSSAAADHMACETKKYLLSGPLQVYQLCFILLHRFTCLSFSPIPHYLMQLQSKFIATHSKPQLKENW